MGCVGFTDNFTEDSDFVNIFGMYFKGKDEVQKRHEDILDDFLKGSIFSVVDIGF